MLGNTNLKAKSYFEDTVHRPNPHFELGIRQIEHNLCAWRTTDKTVQILLYRLQICNSHYTKFLYLAYTMVYHYLRLE